jgi:hypothetical protein
MASGDEFREPTEFSKKMDEKEAKRERQVFLSNNTITLKSLYISHIYVHTHTHTHLCPNVLQRSLAGDRIANNKHIGLWIGQRSQSVHPNESINAKATLRGVKAIGWLPIIVLLPCRIPKP